MQIGSLAKLLLGATLALACSGPSLDLPTRPAASWSLELEPHIDDEIVPLLFRGRVRAATGLEPRARRLFPPPGSAKHGVAVVCDTRIEPSAEELKLAPGDSSLVSDASMAFAGAGCLTLSVQGELRESLVSAPRLGG